MQNAQEILSQKNTSGLKMKMQQWKDSAGIEPWEHCLICTDLGNYLFNKMASVNIFNSQLK